MTDFKAGDTARVDGSKTNDTKWEGLEYTVVEAVPSSYASHQIVTGEVTSYNHPAARTGSIVLFRSTQLYPKATPTEELKDGDKVRYVGPDRYFEGLEGVLLNTGTREVRITKAGKNHEVGQSFWPMLSSLEKIESFTFGDIKVGDKVRRTETWDNTGTKQVIEGTVHALTFSRAATKETLTLGYHNDENNPHITLELLERPEPHFTESAEVGTRYRVRSLASNKWRFLLTKQDDGLWERFDITGGTPIKLNAKDAKVFLDEREHKLVK